MPMTEMTKQAMYKKSFENTAGAAEILDFWKDVNGKTPVAMATGTELGMLRLEHRFRAAKTARAHESMFEEPQPGVWVFTMAFDELEKLYKKGA